LQRRRRRRHHAWRGRGAGRGPIVVERPHHVAARERAEHLTEADGGAAGAAGQLGGGRPKVQRLGPRAAQRREQRGLGGGAVARQLEGRDAAG